MMEKTPPNKRARHRTSGPSRKVSWIDGSAGAAASGAFVVRLDNCFRHWLCALCSLDAQSRAT